MPLGIALLGYIRVIHRCVISGHAGMECAMINIIEPGTKVVVCQNGIWGARATHLAKVMGADVTSINVSAGQAFSLQQIEQALEQVLCRTAIRILIFSTCCAAQASSSVRLLR